MSENISMFLVRVRFLHHDFPYVSNFYNKQVLFMKINLFFEVVLNFLIVGYFQGTRKQEV